MTAGGLKILVINPGSTSTKVALFVGRSSRFQEHLRHAPKSLEAFPSIVAQTDFRRRAVLRAMARHGLRCEQVDVFIARGGLLRPLPGGVYEVGARMIADLSAGRYGEHASNLGAILAAELAGACGKPAYVADPVVVDELSELARVSGHPQLPRRSVFHALSHKAVARKVAARLGKSYEQCNLIVAHVGGGVSVGAHRRGRVVDVNNALEGDGPFSPERTGGLALLPFYRYARRRRLSPDQAARMITRDGGLSAHLGTNDCRRIEAAAGRDRRTRIVYDAFIYQIGKAIGAMAAALSGEVDAIVLTGGVVRGESFRRKLRRRIRFIAPVHVLTELSEMEALASAARSVWLGERKAMAY